MRRAVVYVVSVALTSVSFAGDASAAQRRRYMIAFGTNEYSRNDIVVTASDGGEARVVADNGRGISSGDGAPEAPEAPTIVAWSPDGRQVAYAGGNDSFTDIFVVDTVTGRRRQLTSTGLANDRPAWSPDGRFIAWIANLDNTAQSKKDVFVMRADGSEKRAVTTGGIVARTAGWSGLSWSPDGRKITFSSYPYEGSGDRRIAVVGVDGTGLKVLTADQQNTNPRWSPDGRTIAYVHDLVVNDTQDLLFVAADGSSAPRLSTRIVTEEFSWSRDSRSVLVTTTDSPSRIGMWDVAAKRMRRLPQPAGVSRYRAHWLPDGRIVAQQRDAQKRGGLVVLDGDGRLLRMIDCCGPQVTDVDVSPQPNGYEAALPAPPAAPQRSATSSARATPSATPTAGPSVTPSSTPLALPPVTRPPSSRSFPGYLRWLIVGSFASVGALSLAEVLRRRRRIRGAAAR